MSDATTPNYGWAYPTVNADADTWGTTLNNAIIAIDASLKTVDTETGAAALKANNLSDLANAATARTNLGLGTAATQAASSTGHNLSAAVNPVDGSLAIFQGGNGDIQSLAGITFNSILFRGNNLADVSSTSSARTNLGLGSIATHNVTISSSAPSGGSDGDIWLQYA